jgi:hypothetical protein
VPNGWAEFLERIKQQLESGQTDSRALWSDFLQRSQTSPRAQGLELFAKIVQKFPIEERVAVASLLASILDPLEWPPEWEQHRLALIEALGLLSYDLDPGKPNSLTVLLKLNSDDVGYWNGVYMFLTAGQLLGTPCRRDQLRVVARQSNIGLHSILKTYRHALARGGGSTQSGSLLEARMRFAAAFDRYVQAARALNSAVGEVLFENLDERLEMPET